MKIIIVYSVADLYGASRSLLRLSSRLVKDNHNILVVLGEDGLLVEELRNTGVTVVIMPEMCNIERSIFNKPSKLFEFILKYKKANKIFSKIVQDFKPDIIHTNASLTLTSAVVAKRMNIPHLWHIRESFQEFGFLWLIYRKYMISKSAKILAVSTPIAEQFKKVDLERRKVEVLHNGFPKDEFTSVSKERINRFKSEFNANETINIGVVGRIKFFRKGQEVFIKAAKLVDKKNIKFFIVGGTFPGNEDHLLKLEKLIEESGLKDKVVITGEAKDIKAAYASLDVSVLPSCLPEPFGGVVIESMAMSKPVIGTNIGGTIEQIEEGITGFKVKPNDHHALAEAMSKLIENGQLRIEMGEKGRERFLEKFEFDEFYSKIKEIYNQLLK